MIFGQVYDGSCDFSGKAGYIQVGISGLGIPQILDRVRGICDHGIVFYGEYDRPDMIFDGIYQTDLLHVINECGKPVYGAVVHPPNRHNNYYEFVSLMKMLNKEAAGWVAVENRCRVGGDRLPLFYVTTPFEVQYFLDTRLPMFLDVMALYVSCKHSNELLRKYVKKFNGLVKGYHFINLKANLASNQFRVVNSVMRGDIDYRRLMPHIDRDAFVTMEVRGKERFEREVEWIGGIAEAQAGRGR